MPFLIYNILFSSIGIFSSNDFIAVASIIIMYSVVCLVVGDKEESIWGIVAIGIGNFIIKHIDPLLAFSSLMTMSVLFYVLAYTIRVYIIWFVDELTSSHIKIIKWFTFAEFVAVGIISTYGNSGIGSLFKNFAVSSVWISVLTTMFAIVSEEIFLESK